MANERSGKLEARTVTIDKLSASTRHEMWHLFQRYYADIKHDQFELDLAAKTAVILLLDSRDKSVQGFSTLEVYKRDINGKSVHAVYSGDTIISEGYWGQSALQIAFAKFLGKEFIKNKCQPIHWFLISKGYKTYLLFSRNLLEYYPRFDKPTPIWEKALINSLASDKFGSDWKPEKGVLQFQNAAGRLLEGVAPIDQTLIIRHEDIRFFAEQNPGHVDGDELCCIGTISIQTFGHFISRVTAKLNGPLVEQFQTLTASLKNKPKNQSSNQSGANLEDNA